MSTVIDPGLERFRKYLLTTLIVLVILYALVMIVAGFYLYPANDPNAKVDLLDLMRLRQLSFGMLVAIGIVFLGVTLTVLGIDASVHLKGAGGGFSIGLVTASPGIVLIVAGAVLMGACVLKPYTHSASTTGGTTGTSTSSTTTTIVATGDTTAGLAGFWKSTTDAYKAAKDNPQDVAKWLQSLKLIAGTRRSLLEAVEKELEDKNLTNQLSYKDQIKFYTDLNQRIEELTANNKQAGPEDIKKLIDDFGSSLPVKKS